MKKILIIVVTLVVALLAGIVIFYSVFMSAMSNARETPRFTATVEADKGERFHVFSDNNHKREFNSFDEAIVHARSLPNAYITKNDAPEKVWDNLPAFTVRIGDKRYEYFGKLSEAVAYTKNFAQAEVIHRRTNQVLWTRGMVPAPNFIEDVPLIEQLPELPRGCEVTALCMMLNYAGIEVDKMELAERIEKDTTPLTVKNGRTYYGNPNVGFVGDMYDTKKNGYGVYAAPIFRLAEQYIANPIDLTGCEFDMVLAQVSSEKPVWVIINTTYATLPQTSLQTWETASGPVQATYSEHSVLVTGFDDTYVYFNDPYNRENAAKRENFASAWKQMGSYAVSYVETAPYTGE